MPCSGHMRLCRPGSEGGRRAHDNIDTTWRPGPIGSCDLQLWTDTSPPGRATVRRRTVTMRVGLHDVAVITEHCTGVAVRREVKPIHRVYRFDDVEVTQLAADARVRAIRPRAAAAKLGAVARSLPQIRVKTIDGTQTFVIATNAATLPMATPRPRATVG